METTVKNKKFLYILFALLSVGVFCLVANLLMVLGYVAIPKWILAIKPTQAKSYLFFVDILISLILLGLSFLVYRKLPERKKAEKKALSLSGAGLAVLAGATVFGVNTVLDRILKPAAQAGGAKESLLNLVLTSVIFAPLVEELFFRGMVYRLLDRYKSGWFSILVSALIFGIYHMDPYQALYTALLGTVLAFAYQKTGNIKYPILIHMGNNALAALAASGIIKGL